MAVALAFEPHLSCGTWQQKYTDLHRRILRGQAPQRYLISIPPSTGLADKLVGLPSQLIWAMLTDRAFQTVPLHGFPAYETLFDLPNIDISGPKLSPHITNSPSRVDFSHYLERKGKPGPELSFEFGFDKYFPICLRNNDSANEAILVKSDLKTYPPIYYDTGTLLVESNRGMSYRLFDNPFHGSTLRSLGLTPENAFGCTLCYLFHMKESTCDSTCRAIKYEMERASSNNSVVIGIQIRAGDAAMEGNDATSLRRGAAHFKCAQDLADQELKESGRQAIFYLMSDSISLLTQAKKRYGGQLLADVNTRPAHAARCTNCSTRNHRIFLIQHAMNQVFLFSKCHYHIVSADSGFGMIGAWMNVKPVEDRVFRIGPDVGTRTVCRKGFYKGVVTDPKKLATSWSGI